MRRRTCDCVGWDCAGDYRWCRQTRFCVFACLRAGARARVDGPPLGVREKQNNPDPGSASRPSFTPRHKWSHYGGAQRRAGSVDVLLRVGFCLSFFWCIRDDVDSFQINSQTNKHASMFLPSRLITSQFMKNLCCSGGCRWHCQYHLIKKNRVATRASNSKVS